MTYTFIEEYTDWTVEDKAVITNTLARHSDRGEDWRLVHLTSARKSGYTARRAGQDEFPSIRADTATQLADRIERYYQQAGR